MFDFVSKLLNGLSARIFSFSNPNSFSNKFGLARMKRVNMSNNKFDVVSKLPNELSTQILSFFDVFELARMERVSKSWQTLIRTNSTLWKDDRFDAQVLDPCALQHEAKYRAMLKRCDGKIDKVFLPLVLPFNTQAKLESLLKPLVKSEVKDLWIVIRIDATCPLLHIACARQYNENLSDGQLQDAVKAVLETVVQCGHLRNLRLVTTESVIVNMRNFRDPAKWPFAASRLKKLALHNIRYDSLFPCEEVYQIISEAEEIEICFNDIYSWNFTKKDVWPFINTAKATLKKCRANYGVDDPETYPVLPPIYSFPQLEELNLSIATNGALREPQIIKYSFECPNLKVFHALPQLPSQMTEQLLSSGIEVLSIDSLIYEAEDRRRVFEKLEKCTKVKKLILNRTCSDDDIKELFGRLREAPLEELIMNHVSDETMIEVKKMITDRLSVGRFTKIQKATISTTDGEPAKQIEWFANHVPDFKSYTFYDRIGERDYEFQVHGQYYFELGGRLPGLGCFQVEKGDDPFENFGNNDLPLPEDLY
ncbi:uncharacterized protein FA14DRAFT_152723 [Meira miltonrushii]|uniref:F-box domain-containing protein n=1 Tax=Meira miltonrushii TaxID=1280837 RepID=A0A316VMJ5_9BASI|nr:uncharacterized protein FA14DRAFT_152723 [Meira miltonrushii]PWN37321.1 hypothetical protein FA14DRAFT_152723 [Meira miltonrushii]